MILLPELLAALSTGEGNRLSLPEYRQIELYSKRKVLSFADKPEATEIPVSRVAGLCRSFMVLDALFASQTLVIDEGDLAAAESRPTWKRYLDLPRATGCEKILAELYRILRVAHSIAFHPHGHIEMTEGVVRMNGAINRVALSLELTIPGLTLLESVVTWYLEARTSPWPEPYIEAMLAQYYYDIVIEIKRFSDEDRILYQFRRKFPFNRNYRFDCDNPKMQAAGDVITIEIGAMHRDPVLYPVDFYLSVGKGLYIVPVEALTNGTLPLAGLEQWRVRTPDGLTLPASFRSRFGREVMVIGQPMT